MPVTTGLVNINPWGALEWVTVRATAEPDRYRVLYESEPLFAVDATEQAELVEQINKAWRSRFPRGKAPP